MSDSVVRRVALPGAFLATDGLFETFLAVLDGFAAYPAVIERELAQYLPFLATTKVLMAAVRAGVGREQAHEVIKEHAMAVAQALREVRRERPGRAPGRPTTACGSTRPPSTPCSPTGPASWAALHQVDAFCRQVEAIVADHPEAARYRPEPIL